MSSTDGTSPPPLAALALALTEEGWHSLGTSKDPLIAPTDNVDVLIERMTALLWIRIIAITAQPGRYPDLATSSICRTAIRKNYTWQVSDTVRAQLQEFVKRIVTGYKEGVPYHNREHCYHVVLSMNRLIDMMIVTPTCTTSSGSQAQYKKKKPTITFGLRNDPLALFSLVFSSLIHDVEHQGIPNRQLALEDDRLAVLYNDQSIAENWSIYIGFSDLLQDEFKELRAAVFINKDEYLRFRKMTINLVLTTDIASPERTQLVKSKWKEAFGDPIESIERKVEAARRMSLTGRNVMVRSFPKANRRGTGDTNVSEVSFECSPRRRASTLRSDPLDTAPEDESPSVTPETSDIEEQDNSNSRHPSMELADPLPAGLSPRRQQQQVFSSMTRSRRSSTTTTNSGSTNNPASARYRQRLGILRTVDLSGETLEHFPRSGLDSSGRSMSLYSVADFDDDEPDELKATVVMETFMQAADVAHNLQGWEQMVKFSNRLYMELRKSFVAKRGINPEPKWFENQIGFLESYLLPLARRLEDTEVFQPHETTGEYTFAKTVENNRDRWLTEGFDIAQKAIDDGAKEYPFTG